MKPTTLRESIIATVCYFDLFEYPLTLHELWVFLLYPPTDPRPSLDDVVREMQTMKDIEWIQGFICRTGRSECIESRIQRYTIAERKIRKALRFSRLCALVPGVSMISLCNTLAFSNAREESDIDLFIVARKGYLWFVRAAAIVISFLFGRRLSALHMRDALCLSFFVSTDGLDLSSLALPSEQGIDDVYLAVWVSRCIPIYDESGSYRAFWQANAWSGSIVPNRIEYVPNYMRRIVLGRPSRIFKYIASLILVPVGYVEHFCESIQRKKFPADLMQAAARQDSGVVIGPSVLKFHLNDRRAEFRALLCERIKSTRL